MNLRSKKARVYAIMTKRIHGNMRELLKTQKKSTDRPYFPLLAAGFGRAAGFEVVHIYSKCSQYSRDVHICKCLAEINI